MNEGVKYMRYAGNLATAAVWAVGILVAGLVIGVAIGVNDIMRRTA